MRARKKVVGERIVEEEGEISVEQITAAVKKAPAKKHDGSALVLLSADVKPEDALQFHRDFQASCSHVRRFPLASKGQTPRIDFITCLDCGALMIMGRPVA